MSTVSAGTKIACRVDVPEPQAARARYALESLLAPLGLEPEWSGRPRIIYGPITGSVDAADRPLGSGGTPESRATGASGGAVRSGEPGVVHLACSAAAADFFTAGRRPYDPSQVAAIEWEGEEWPALFVDENGEPDLVASAFLFLSGWHEAAVATRDEHGRVPCKVTLPGLLDQVERPVVDAYRAILAAKLSSEGMPVHQRTWGGRAWAFCPTHDVDYLRKGRPGIWYRELVHHLVLNDRDVSPSERLARIAGYVRQIASGDPYRAALTRMIREVAERGGTATYFLKAGAEDPHDVAYSLSDRFLQQRLEELNAKDFEIALHPSYRSLDDPEMMRHERDRLQAAARTPLRAVRQHYLRYDPESTPRLHAEAGFTIDSTIGFADRPGFRRGTCLPHRLFDLQNDRPLDVWEMPLTIMESALFNRQDMTVDEAVESTRLLTATCRRFGGACVVLWHNTLWDELDCPGWGEHFTRTLQGASRDDALIASLHSALRAWR